MPPTPPPQTVWAEDLDPHAPPPRTLPLRHAERMAGEVLERVAAGRRPPRRTPAWWGAAAGVGLMAAGGAAWWWHLDAGLLHLPAAVLVAGGLAVALKAVMGYR